MTQLPHSSAARRLCTSLLLALVAASAARTQETKPQASTEKPLELPAQIELLETHIRFESNGDSRKEVHTRVHINNELGARQFARLSFDYNRAFQQIEFPLVRITHEGGGTADILPSAISDQPNPAVVNAPAYQDVRVKSVRILGLAPGDLLEYRVVTTTTHHPLAPEFWLDHTFDRSGITAHEIFELDIPFSSQAQRRFAVETPPSSSEKSGKGDSERALYKWDLMPSSLPEIKSHSSQPSTEPDIALSTFTSWIQLSERLRAFLPTGSSTQIWADAMKLIGNAKEPVPDQQLYDLVRRKIATLELPLDFSMVPMRESAQILSSGYGRPEEKVELLFVLHGQQAIHHPLNFRILAYTDIDSPQDQLPRPSLLKGLLLNIRESNRNFYLDPGLEVAPFGAIRADLRGKKALVLGGCSLGKNACWSTIPLNLPFPSFQRVNVDAAIAADGTLAAKVTYRMRGDNELVLRLAFHQSPKEKWKEVAGLLALSDGFRGRITNVTASDPYATEKPFTVEYEISQPKFVDWSKKPVRIPALLPQLGLPDPTSQPATAATPAAGASTSATSAASATSAIDLGTPLDVETHLTLHLPPGTSAHPPIGNAVVRDYATFTSTYSVAGNAVTVTRHLNFLERQIPADRAADYSAFVRAVHSDESQEFTLERTDSMPAKQSLPLVSRKVSQFNASK